MLIKSINIYDNIDKISTTVLEMEKTEGLE